MSALLEPAGASAERALLPRTATVLDVVIPVYDEEAQLEASVERVLAHLRTLP